MKAYFWSFVGWLFVVGAVVVGIVATIICKPLSLLDIAVLAYLINSSVTEKK
jgi:hypothetical protein